MESLSLTARGFRLRRLDDEAVASRTLSGDPAAFVELHRRFRKRIEASCAQRLDSSQAAEDAAQETFIRVLRAAPQKIENVEAWLFTIARNVCIDVSRRASRVESPAEESTFQDVLPTADSATELMRRDNARQVFLALRRLPTRYRTALTLREFHGMSSAEIAESMNVSLGAVDSMVSRARDSFGAAYAEASGFPEACRVSVERIYRSLGTGIDDAEQEQLDAHIYKCARCRAEYKRAHSPRYIRGLLPFLVAKMPALNVLADALSRSAEAPAVMQSFPALTATAVATLSAAVVLSPVAVNQAVKTRVAASKARIELSRQYHDKQSERLVGLPNEIPPFTSESSAAAVGTETAEAPVTPETSAVAEGTGGQPEQALDAANGASTPDRLSGTTHIEAPSGKSGETATPKPEGEGGKPTKPEEPAASAPKPGTDSPAPKPEPPAVAGSDGWGSLPADADFEAPESANQ